MHLRCDGIFNDQCITQSLLSSREKKIWKSVNICRSYGQLSTMSSFFYFCIVYNAVLHSSLTGITKILLQVQNTAARIALQASSWPHVKPLLHQLHWLPVQKWITYKLTVLTHKAHSMSTLIYPHHPIMKLNSTLISHAAVGLTVYQDGLFQACFPVFSTVCLELATTNSCDRWLWQFYMQI